MGVALEGFKRFTSVMMAATGFGYGVVFLWIAIYNVGTFVDLTAWLAAFALTAWTGYRALVAVPQPARRDQRALPLSFFIATVGTWVVSDLTTDGTYNLGSSYVVGLLTGRISVDQFLAAFAAPSATLAVGLVTVPLYGFWVQDVLDWHRRDDWRKYAYAPYFLAAATEL